MRLQLWSYNYAPEVTGIAPVSEVWAQAMKALGHDVDVLPRSRIIRSRCGIIPAGRIASCETESR